MGGVSFDSVRKVSNTRPHTEALWVLSGLGLLEPLQQPCRYGVTGFVSRSIPAGLAHRMEGKPDDVLKLRPCSGKQRRKGYGEIEQHQGYERESCKEGFGTLKQPEVVCEDEVGRSQRTGPGQEQAEVATR